MTTQQKAEALARECANGTSWMAKRILDVIPLTELLAVAEAAKDRQDFDGETTKLAIALTALSAKLPKGIELDK